MFIFDIAVPRDVDEEVSKIPGVYLYDMDALQRITASARARREEQIEIFLKSCGSWSLVKLNSKDNQKLKYRYAINTGELIL